MCLLNFSFKHFLNATIPFILMSGENLQTFVTKYKPEDAEKLTLRMKNGLGSSKYKPTEYERLQAIVDAKRLESELIGQKVPFSYQVYPHTEKKNNITEQAEDELHHFLEQIRPIGITDTAIFSLQEYGKRLTMEQEAFRKDTVDPVHQLRDDLRFRLSNVQLSKLSSNFEQVTQQVCMCVCVCMCDEIRKYLISASVNSESLPKEVLDADCPYPELKDSLIQAFQSLSERYQSRLQSLQEQLQKTDRFCGWCPEDHEHFQLTVSMYTHDTPNHRALCMDMLLRRFPERTRLELVGDFTKQYRHFSNAQMKAVTQRWHRDLEELLARALVMLQEAEHAHKEELEHHRERQHQQDICLRLREKVSQWRTQQEEVAKLEAAIAARRQEDEEGRMKRDSIKPLRSLQVRCVRSEKAMLPEALLKEQGVTCGCDVHSLLSSPFRVQFRADMLQRQREDREARELEQQREEQERQNRLEVEVQAEADPERMMADTEAWRSRLVNEKQFELQRPLYSLNTYTDTQIVSDPRVRAERALREAGLHQNQYAKEVLSDIKPPRPPRRDTKSTIKF
uniref:Coiled-coil domain containing 148 n=1 Tax=Kryptolebias marmoratus TaxID=37003 RepID=A0A3Q3ANQ1_KRYMA